MEAKPYNDRFSAAKTPQGRPLINVDFYPKIHLMRYMNLKWKMHCSAIMMPYIFISRNWLDCIWVIFTIQIHGTINSLLRCKGHAPVSKSIYLLFDFEVEENKYCYHLREALNISHFAPKQIDVAMYSATVKCAWQIEIFMEYIKIKFNSRYLFTYILSICLHLNDFIDTLI